MMTTMAALLGALPLALGAGTGAELRRPLGITIVGGLIVTQLLTLYTTPVVYLYLDRFRLFLRRRGRWRPRTLRGGPRLMLTTSMSPRRAPTGASIGPRPSRAARAASLLSVLLLVSAVLSSRAARGDKVESTPAPKRPAVPVGVAAVEQKTIPLQIQAIGTVEASAVVSIKAQVGGELLRVHIKEGQDVKKGDLLFSIDPRVYEAALAQAEANLARDRGQIQQARAVLERDQSRVGQARAGLLRDQAQAKNAEVQEKRYADLLAGADRAGAIRRPPHHFRVARRHGGRRRGRHEERRGDGARRRGRHQGGRANRPRR